MKLILTTRDPYDCNYCAEDGQVLYMVACPYKFVNRRATIDKVIPADSEDIMHDKFERIAEIEFHTVTPSTISYENTKHSAGSFFRKGNFALLGRDRVFEDHSGKEYRWSLSTAYPELYSNDEEKTLLAKFVQQEGLAHINPDARPAMLKIYPAGEGMVDLIVITLVYVEKYRRDRERGKAT